ncbi:MAG: hypothetical protein Q4G59_08420 [Planctomycetia bacterium]|nr:hypothetical protein [Planctomycetia bacterium]
MAQARIRIGRIDPECDGFSYWSIVDGCTIQSGADTFVSQGFLNPFWEPKPGGITPKELYHSNGPTVFLLKDPMQHQIFTSGETPEFEFHLSHFGHDDIPAGTFGWKISEGQKILLQGNLHHEKWQTGKVGPLEKIQIPIPSVTAPCHCRLTIEIPGSNVSNSWDIWLFPRRELKSIPQLTVSPALEKIMNRRYKDIRPVSESDRKNDLLLVSSEEKELIKNGIKRGQRMIILAPASKESNIHLGWWTLGQQLGMAMPTHPVFGNFPKSEMLDGLWLRLVRQGAPDLKTDLGFGHFTPLVIGQGIQDYKLYMGMAHANDSVIIAVFALDLFQDTPECMNLLDNLIQYLLNQSKSK